MMKKTFSFLFLCLFSQAVFAQQTVGLVTNTYGYTNEGYVMFSPMSMKKTFLIDLCGKLVHTWVGTTFPAQTAYLLPDGTLLRPNFNSTNVFPGPAKGGVLERRAWDGTLLWSYSLFNSQICQHHDIEPLPNGNILCVVMEVKTNAQALAAGANPTLNGALVMNEKIVELQPYGTNGALVVWEWSVWDHLVQDFDSTKANYGVIAANPGKINVNYRQYANNIAEWLHMNSVKYNAALDQIVISPHHFNEIWIIDHSTTTQQAASSSGGHCGKGGDILYRWGNPHAYDQGTTADTKLFGMHDPYWITGLNVPDSGSIMVFNNGLDRPAGPYSTIEILNPPMDTNGCYVQTIPFLPDSSKIAYIAPNPTDFYAALISGSQMLPNGNILTCSGPQGTFFISDPSNQTIWKYINPAIMGGAVSQGSPPPNSSVFRATYLEPGNPGFNGQTLTPGNPIELNPLPYDCDLTTGIYAEPEESLFLVWPNPASEWLFIGTDYTFYTLELLSSQGQILGKWENESAIPLQSVSNGIYILRLIPRGKQPVYSRFAVAR